MAFKQDKQLAGLEVDFARTLGGELGREVKFIELDWEDQIPSLLNGKTDIIMSSMSITTARQMRVSFCAPYLRIGQMGLVRRENLGQYALGFPIQPAGVIGVKKATTGDFLAQQEFPRSKRKEYATGDEAARALVKKRIDLFISDETLVWWLASENEANGLAPVPIRLSDEQLAWAVNKTNTDLLSAANSALAKMQQDGRATGFLKHWLPAMVK